MKLRACSRKRRRHCHERGLVNIVPGGGWQPGVPKTFSNLFNLGTRRVPSESYLCEYRIKQSDKCLSFTIVPATVATISRGIKVSRNAVRLHPLTALSALWYMCSTLACHTVECLWDKIFTSFFSWLPRDSSFFSLSLSFLFYYRFFTFMSTSSLDISL